MRLLALLLLLLAHSAHASGTLDHRYFTRIPVLHEGRIKPMGSFAQAELHAFSGSDARAIPWLAEALFDPASALDRELFHVPSEALRNLLALPERGSDRYTLQETLRALQQQSSLTSLEGRDDNSLSAEERALLALRDNVGNAAELLRSFSLLLPLEVPEDLRKELKLPEGPITYLELTKVKEALRGRVKELVKKKGEDVAAYTPEESRLAILALRFQTLENAGMQNRLFRVIPSLWDTGEWFSPWAIVMEGKAAPGTGQTLALWGKLAQSYRDNDAEAWSAASRALYERAPVTHWKLGLEHWYYALHLTEAAMALYALAFFLLVIPAKAGIHVAAKQRSSLKGFRHFAPNMGSRLRGNDGILSPLVFLTLTSALTIHAAILLARVLILGRPPVSTLYESILFVSFIVAAASFLWPGKNFRKERWLAGAGLGALLLGISPVYASGDTMGVLVAVLNTNFWLATHVLCITAGYGWCLIAGTLSHFWLFKEARRKKGRVPKAPPAYLVTLTVVALLFMSLGTILGGIWADQSWGRFWGWDPKENGALLIVLWLIWLLHGKASGHFGPLMFAALLALLNAVVAISWFGVNLLGTGLHSYGFTHAAALGLFLFCTAELLFAGGAYYYARRR